MAVFARKDVSAENVDAVVKGLVNLERHIENIRNFGVPPVVAINHFAIGHKIRNMMRSSKVRESLACAR